jgi:predicted ATP-binding protein involved in virulence
MKLKELHLTNFRGFEQLDIEFKDRLAVFIGTNGVGKTAVLDAICLCFIEVVNRMTHNLVFVEFNYNRKTDVKKHKVKVSLDFELEFKNVTNLRLEINNAENTARFASKINSELANAFTNLEIIDEESILAFNFPVLLHYKGSTEEEKDNITTYIDSIAFPQYNAYQNAFFHSINNFSDFIEWFKEEEDLENQLIVAKKNFDAQSKTLSTIRKSIIQFLFKLNRKLIFSDLKINREAAKSGELKGNGHYALTIKKDGEQFDLSQLSEGEKIMTMLVSDIARRLTIANPSLDNPLEGEGIVLIDEIDLHLHPQWQREVIPALLATFPKLQFIVTTHSPQVLSKVKKESVFILENGKLVQDVPYTYGRNASAILFEIFGVTDRPIEVQEKINRCFQLLEEEKYEKAKILLKELTNLLGEHDEAVVGAQTQLLFDNQMAE